MWDFTLRLDQIRERSLFMQIAQAIAADIGRGRLRPGDRLPGSRTLARTVGVNRVTVLAAYDELAAEGWVATHPARGTFVSADLPCDEAPARPRAIGGPAAFTLPPGPALTKWLAPARGTLSFRSSYPDTRLIRTEPMLRAYRRVLRRTGGALFGYGDPEGHPRLRRAIAAMLRDTRALAISPENVLITRGSQMALALAGRALLRPGDAIAVEDPGYRFAWEAFRQSGATLVPVPVDASGLDVAALAAHVARSPIRAVYLTPHHQLPTTVTLTAERREALLGLARAHRFVVIEDDYDHEFHFAERPAVPLASLDPGLVLYVGTFSKTLAPGLRIGYLVAPAPVVEQASAFRQAIDLQGDPAMEATLAEMIEDGEVQRHVRRVKRIYRTRRDLLADLLDRHLPHVLGWSVPAGGIGLWAQAAPEIDVDRWASSALRRGIAFLTARSFTFDGRSRPFLRLGYACLDETELRAAVERMSRAVGDVRGQSRVVGR